MKAYADQIGAIDYLANICVVLELTQSLSELYWMNVNDPEFPLSASSSIPISTRPTPPVGVISSTFALLPASADVRRQQ